VQLNDNTIRVNGLSKSGPVQQIVHFKAFPYRDGDFGPRGFAVVLPMLPERVWVLSKAGLAAGLRSHGYIPMVPKLLTGVAAGTENGNASHASRLAPERPTVTVSTWPPAIGDANTGTRAGTGFDT
jgi:hypothetical protein